MNSRSINFPVKTLPKHVATPIGRKHSPTVVSVRKGYSGFRTVEMLAMSAGKMANETALQVNMSRASGHLRNPGDWRFGVDIVVAGSVPEMQ